MPEARFTLRQAREIRRRRAAGESLTALATSLDCAYGVVQRMCKGETYVEFGQERHRPARLGFWTAHTCEFCRKRFRYWQSKYLQPRRFCGQECAAKSNNPYCDHFNRLPDSDTLARHYRSEELTLSQIARMYGVSKQHVADTLEKLGIPRIQRWARVKIEEGKGLPDWDTVARHYQREGLTLVQIAQLYGVSKANVHYTLKKAGIPRRRRRAAK